MLSGASPAAAIVSFTGAGHNRAAVPLSDSARVLGGGANPAHILVDTGRMKNERTATVVPSEEGRLRRVHWAYCPEVPAANGQGETIEEAKADLAEAIGFVLEFLRDQARCEHTRRELVVVG